jgi:hypothetical protein
MDVPCSPQTPSFPASLNPSDSFLLCGRTAKRGRASPRRPRHLGMQKLLRFQLDERKSRVWYMYLLLSFGCDARRHIIGKPAGQIFEYSPCRRRLHTEKSEKHNRRQELTVLRFGVKRLEYCLRYGSIGVMEKRFLLRPSTHARENFERAFQKACPS